MLSPRGSHGAHPLPAGGRCSRRGYCCPYCWPSGTTILYPRIWVGIYSVDGCGFTINPQHHPLPPSSQNIVVFFHKLAVTMEDVSVLLY
uniref:Uncharacterized protein n=1 Tax=Setaria viridis TaxID=4556 RepID=A0A4V6D5H0_SETVI|nr:hypothetical protein SEVIR_6G161600v2 [Setaria viridis]